MASLSVTAPRTLVDVLVARRRAAAPSPWVLDAALVAAFSVFIALTARLVIPLPFTPVPITGSTFGVLFTGALLGGRRGALAVLLYLAEGALGLPVFASGAGTAYFLGPTAGYLLTYPLAAGLVGLLAERGWDRRPSTTVLAMVIGNAVIYAGGVLWLSSFSGGIVGAVRQGMLPFLPGDALKIALAAALLPGGWAFVRRHGDR